jgi:hypothetical protein
MVCCFRRKSTSVKPEVGVRINRCLIKITTHWRPRRRVVGADRLKAEQGGPMWTQPAR